MILFFRHFVNPWLNNFGKVIAFVNEKWWLPLTALSVKPVVKQTKCMCLVAQFICWYSNDVCYGDLWKGLWLCHGDETYYFWSTICLLINLLLILGVGMRCYSRVPWTLLMCAACVCCCQGVLTSLSAVHSVVKKVAQYMADVLEDSRDKVQENLLANGGSPPPFRWYGISTLTIIKHWF